MCEALRELMKDEIQEELEKQKNIGISEGISQGEQLGKAQINELNQILIEADRLDDLKRSTTDPEYQQQLLKEFDL